MFCPKCGDKIEKGASFCTKCGKKVTGQEKPSPETKQAKPAAKKQEAKPPISLSFDPKLKKIITLAITAILVLAGGYLLFNKFIKKQPAKTSTSSKKEKPSLKEDRYITSEEEDEEETSETGSALIITDEYIEERKSQRTSVETDYSFLKDLEFLHIKEAFQKAAKWDKDAQLYNYYLLINNDPTANPYVSFKFFSPNQNEQLDVVWYSSGKTKEEAEKDKNFDGDPLVNFPPELSLEETIDIAIEELTDITPIPITIKSFSVILDEGNDNIWTSITADTTKKLDTASCRVQFTREVKCNKFRSLEE